ncbi:hypothetical protein GYMLUDRAFT_83217 [Collybiopsis luxurians FD-317 M1]|nr:hypothetical protein GYMLUDRAFT_83217 [Collybiopsis luxurians FD-317 M1]
MRKTSQIPVEPFTVAPNDSTSSNSSQTLLGTFHATTSSNSGTVSSPSRMFVQLLVNRLKNKLPYNSGESLDRLESDNATQQAVDALVNLAHETLDVVGQAVAELLEKLIKQKDSHGVATIELLQSQLFLLKVLSVAMATRSQPAVRPSSRASTIRPTDDRSTVNSLAPTEKLCWSDSPPLDEASAKYLLLVMILHLRQTAVSDPPLISPLSRFGDVSFRDYDAEDIASKATVSAYIHEATGFSVYGDHSRPPSVAPSIFGNQTINSYVLLSGNDSVYEKTPSSYINSAQSLTQQIQKYAGRIISYISASNWKIVFQRLQSRIPILLMPSNKSPDFSDLWLLEHSVLDRRRLLQILNELSSLLVNMSEEGHKAIAGPLRAAIWSWIDHFPHEFNEVVNLRGGKMTGASSIFDFLYSMYSGSERVIWPTLSILRCIIPERMSDFRTLGFNPDLFNHPSKLASTLLACTTDICRAAMYIKPTDDDIPLQAFGYDLANELKTYIWNPTGKSFWEFSQDIDVALWAEVLISVFRFLQDTRKLFLVCLEPQRSDAVKLCAVRACLTLAQEVSQFPWQKPLEELEKVVGPRLRYLLRTCVSAEKSPSRPRMKRILEDALTDRELLLLGIFSVWQARRSFFFAGLSEIEFDEWSGLPAKIFGSSLSIAVKISAASAILREFELAFQLDLSDPNHEMFVHWLKITLYQMLSTITITLFSTRTEVETQRVLAGILLRLLELFARNTYDPILEQIQRDPARIAPMVLAEIALLVSLSSADIDVSRTAARGLRLVAHIENQSKAPINPTVKEEDKSKRYSVYDRLGDPKFLVVGRVAHQKRIRKLLRPMPYCSAVNIVVWREIHARFTNLTESLLNNERTDIRARSESYMEVYQWQNFVLFLAVTANTDVQGSNETPSLSSVIPQEMLLESMRASPTPEPLISTFVNDLTALLIYKDVQIRDAAREALGVDLDAQLHPAVLKYTNEVVRSMSLKDGNDDGMRRDMLLFVDQLIVVLKAMVENGPERINEFSNEQFFLTLLSLAVFITRLQSPEIFRIKQKFCSLCDIVCDGTSIPSARKDKDIPRGILDTIVEWIVPPKTVTGNLSNVYEVNMSCLRTIVNLLDGLQLSPTVDSVLDDGLSLASRLVIKYLNVLLNGPQNCQPDLTISDSLSDVSSIQRGARASPREIEIRKLVITGLSNLVSANPESGFKHCLPLAYNGDNSKRTIFALAFARALSHGIKFDFENKRDLWSAHRRLAEFIKGADMTLVMTICSVCSPAEMDAMVAVLLNLFDSRASLIKLVKVMIEHEVARTEIQAELFLSNSICTRFLSAFARIHGYNYLRTLIGALIKSMESLPASQGFELDPMKAGGQDIVENRKKIESLAHMFLEAISSSVSTLPSMFREISAHIVTTVNKRWPDARFVALGSFVFLRFISPAIVAPETINLDPPGDTRLRRGLTLIAKIVQNLANNIFFGKEGHMVVLNDFLRDHSAHITRYLAQLKRYTSGEGNEEEWLGTGSDETDIIFLHRFLDMRADKIGKEFLSVSNQSGAGSNSVINNRRVWGALCALLIDLGPALDVPETSDLDRRYHHKYKELMSRNANKSIDSVQDIICETVPPSQSDGTGYLVFRASKVNVELLDMELFMYHFFKIVDSSRYDDCDVAVIIDCTDFTSTLDFPLRWVKLCQELIPADIRIRLTMIHILNLNVPTQKFLRRVYNFCAGFGASANPRVWASIAEMASHIPTSVIESPALKYTLSLEREQSDLFTDVVMLGTHMLRRPVKLSVGVTRIKITSMHTLDIAPGLACKPSEVVLLADVSDAYKIKTGFETNEFILRRRQGVIYFTSPDRESIIRTIRAAKSRIQDHQMPFTEQLMQFPSIPVALLQLGMFSVDGYNEELRGAAFGLLGAVCTYLNYDKTPLAASKAGFNPGTMNEFVINLSTSLAEFAPQLTLDFLSQAVSVIHKNGNHEIWQVINCLRYMSTWIKNLELFADPSSPLFQSSEGKLRDCIRMLISVNLDELALNAVQKHLWTEAGKLNGAIIDIIFDELVRSAIDSGVGTRRCEIIAHSIASAGSIAIRGRLFSRLRKAVVRASPQVSIQLSQNMGWHEVSTLIRIASVIGTGTGHPTDSQLYVPDIVHIATLAAGIDSMLIRKSVYGMITNLVHSLYLARMDEGPVPELQQLIQELTQEAVFNLFGLSREAVTNEYSNFDFEKEKLIIQNQEKLTALLVRVMDVSAGSKGQLNVWKARWMSLATAQAFQNSSMIQTRSFITLATLATSDVDDGLMYQMLVAFRAALVQTETADIAVLVSMLRCITKVVPSLQADTRYITQLFWLAVACLQSSHIVFFEDAAALVSFTMKEMEKRGTFTGSTVPVRLLKDRLFLEEPAKQLDSISQLSCEASLSFCLAVLLFRAVRHSGLRDSAQEALRTLLRITTRVGAQTQDQIHGYPGTLDPDALGYFLALVSLSTTTADYRDLLKDCGIQEDPFLEEETTTVSSSYQVLNVPHVSIELLGIQDSNTALLAASFIGVMLMTAQADDAESQMLFGILADVAIMFPETIQSTYEILQDKIKDTFANSSNPTIIQYVSNIIRVALDDESGMGWRTGVFRHSSATVNTVGETYSVVGPTRSELKTLEEQGMQGLAKNSQFLSAKNTEAKEMLKLISNLVVSIIT